MDLQSSSRRSLGRRARAGSINKGHHGLPSRLPRLHPLPLSTVHQYLRRKISVTVCSSPPKLRRFATIPFLFHFHLQRSRPRRAFPESLVLLGLVEQQGTWYCFVEQQVSNVLISFSCNIQQSLTQFQDPDSRLLLGSSRLEGPLSVWWHSWYFWECQGCRCSFLFSYFTWNRYFSVPIPTPKFKRKVSACNSGYLFFRRACRTRERSLLCCNRLGK